MKIQVKVLPGGTIIYEDITSKNAKHVIESRGMYLETFQNDLTKEELEECLKEIEFAKSCLVEDIKRGQQ